MARLARGCAFVVAAVLAVPAWGQPGPRPRVAVLDFEADPGSNLLSRAELDVLTEDVRQDAVDALRQWFDVIDKENVEVLLRESGTDLARCLEGECEVKVGQELQAAAVISGRVSLAGKTLVLRLSAHKTDGGSVIKKVSAEGRDFAELRARTRQVSPRIVTEVLAALPHGAGPAFRDREIGSRPEAWTAPAADLAVVSFESQPAGAVVQVDGKLLCQQTPCSKTLALGTHMVTMQKERYLDRTEAVRVESSSARVSWPLPPDFGWLTVRSSPAGLPTFLDGRSLGATPVNRLEVAPGPHEVTVRHPQYHELGRAVQVDRGQEKVVDLDPTPRQGALRVTAVDGRGNAVPADVSVDGTPVGAAPGQWTVLAGTHSLVVKSRVGVWKGDATVREDQVTEVAAETKGAFPGQCTAVDGTRGGTMCHVPAGNFRAGCETRDGFVCVKGEENGHLENVSAFWIDRTEVTVSEYGKCVRDGACSLPAPGEACNWNRGRSDHPINCVGFEQATKFCEWAGKRLPSEEEWEKAARGEDGRRYPWGNQAPTCSLAVMDSGGQGCGARSTAPVGSRSAGRSPYNVMDLAGNLWEWVGTTRHALRGGSWVDAPGLMRSSLRLTEVPTRGFANTGFRCARFAD